MTKFCPTCGQALPDPRRPKKICIKCRQPIRRHDRWHFEFNGPAHNDCQMPMGVEAELKHQRMLEIVKSAMGANTEGE